MKKLFFLLIFLNINLLSNSLYLDSINFQKIKKLVAKEETIAFAYKEYLLKNGKKPKSIATLINNSFLPISFNKISSFGKIMEIDDEAIKINIPNIELKLRSKSYYFSNENREHTLSPITKYITRTKIKFSSFESFIIKNSSSIVINKADAKNKYFLENKILHWYDSDNKYKFSFYGDLFLGEDINLFITKDTLSDEFKNLFKGKGILFPGQNIFQKVAGEAYAYTNLDEETVIKNNESNTLSTTNAIIQFTRRAGGMIVNGEIYTWGNNSKKINSISTNSDNNAISFTYGNKVQSSSEDIVVNTTLIKARAIIYNSNNTKSEIINQNYYNSPFRPVFVDFASDSWHSTCGISAIGALYCAGNSVLRNNYIDFYGFNKNSTNYLDIDKLYKSKFFSGATSKPKAKRIIQLISTFLVLSKSGDIYYWGNNRKQGYHGGGNRTSNAIRTPTNVNTGLKFQDIVYTLSIGYRRIAGLTKAGHVYTWGLDYRNVINNNTCRQKILINNTSTKTNLCSPLKVSEQTFVSIVGGQQNFILKDLEGSYHKLTQKKGYGPTIEEISTLIKDSKYSGENQTSRILSVDISSNLPNSGSITRDNYGEGLVWVTDDNKLNGDYFTNDNRNDQFFKDAIDKIKWKTIKVVEDRNGMCGIDIYNQMYCWGVMSYFSSSVTGNNFMLPVFNLNLHDYDKDFMIAKAENNQSLTTLTSGEWVKTINNDNAYFVKYPTFVGGFNYEFTFK